MLNVKPRTGEKKWFLIIEDGKVNNGHIVLSKPLSLPEGTEIRVQNRTCGYKPPLAKMTIKIQILRNPKILLICHALGCGQNREDMQDSVAWVHKERENLYDSRIKS